MNVQLRFNHRNASSLFSGILTGLSEEEYIYTEKYWLIMLEGVGIECFI